MGQFLITRRSPSCFLRSHSSSPIPAEIPSPSRLLLLMAPLQLPEQSPPASGGRKINKTRKIQKINKRLSCSVLLQLMFPHYSISPSHEGEGFVSRWTHETTADLGARFVSTSRLPTQYPSPLHRESIVCRRGWGGWGGGKEGF